MTPLVNNNMIFGCLILFIIVSIASQTLNYMSVQTNKDMLDNEREKSGYIKNITENMYQLVQQNNLLMKQNSSLVD